MGRTIVVFRSPFLGYTPQQRAESAQARLKRIVDSDRESEAVTVTDAPRQGKIVRVGMELVFTILENDVNTLEGETLDSVAINAADSLRETLQMVAEGQSWQALLWDATSCVGATLGLLAMLYLILRFYRWLYQGMMRQAERRAAHLAIGQFYDLSEAFITATNWLARVLLWGVVFYLLYTWMAFCLRCFPNTRTTGQHMQDLLFSVIANAASGFAQALPGLVFVVLVVVITYNVVHLIDLFFNAVEEGRVPVPESFRETSRPSRFLLKTSLWLCGLVAAWPYVPGSGSEALRGVLMFLGILLSLGSSGVVSHVAAGVILTYSRRLKVGDYVRVEPHEGTVIDVGLLCTRIRTEKREEVSVPNSVLVGTITKNFTRRGGGPGDHPAHQRDRRIRHPVAAGTRPAAHGGGTDRGPEQGAGPVRVPGCPGRLLRGIPGQCVPGAARDADSRPGCPARPHPGCLQRAWRADHVSPLRDGPGKGQGRATRTLVRCACAKGLGPAALCRWSRPALDFELSPTRTADCGGPADLAGGAGLCRGGRRGLRTWLGVADSAGGERRGLRTWLGVADSAGGSGLCRGERTLPGGADSAGGSGLCRGERTLPGGAPRVADLAGGCGLCRGERTLPGGRRGLRTQQGGTVAALARAAAVPPASEGASACSCCYLLPPAR